MGRDPPARLNHRIAPVVLDGGDTPVDGGQVGDVERADPGLATGFISQSGCRDGGLLDVAAVDHHPGTGLEQALGKCVTDPPDWSPWAQADSATQIEQVHRETIIERYPHRSAVLQSTEHQAGLAVRPPGVPQRRQPISSISTFGALREA